MKLYFNDLNQHLIDEFRKEKFTVTSINGCTIVDDFRVITSFSITEKENRNGKDGFKVYNQHGMVYVPDDSYREVMIRC